MDSTLIAYLLQRHEDDTITTGEKDELYALLRSFDNNDEILAWLENSYQNTTPQSIDTDRWKPVLEYILRQQARVVPMRKRTNTIRWIAAACIILVMGYGLWVMRERSQVTGNKSHVAQTHDVPAPSNTRAVITLADGTKVYLDSAGNGTIAQENNVAVVKNEKGEILYNTVNASTPLSMTYNTLYNPRGSKAISLTLSDGTRVWLNSESSLRYPASFAPTAVNREVEITGEAYFEIKHNPKQPFKVHLPNGSVVEDIGTAFNINAYSDESNIKTTLIEGSARVMLSGVEAQTRAAILKPGQQASIVYSSTPLRVTGIPLRVTSDVDTEEVLAWKNGKFVFNKTDIQTTMRQIARWYDVEIVYKDEVKGFFSGGISRLENASQVLKMLEMTGEVHFEIQGKKIIVSK